MLRPGFTRGVIGFFIGLGIGIALISIIRLFMGLPFSTGPSAFFGGFGGLFGWLWGVGTFSPLSHEHNGFEHAAEHAEPGAVQKTMQRVRASMPGIMANVKPLVRPLLYALGITVIVLVAIMAISMVLGTIDKPIARIQTEKPLASPGTPNGDIVFGETVHVNKTVFFLILSAIILGMLGGLAVVIALIMNAVSRNVEEAKASPDNPPQTEPPLFRLIDFFVTWVHDILEGTKRSVQR
jgi:hypothetical protein